MAKYREICQTSYQAADDDECKISKYVLRGVWK